VDANVEPSSAIDVSSMIGFETGAIQGSKVRTVKSTVKRVKEIIYRFVSRYMGHRIEMIKRRTVNHQRLLNSRCVERIRSDFIYFSLGSVQNNSEHTRARARAREHVLLTRFVSLFTAARAEKRKEDWHISNRMRIPEILDFPRR